MAVVPGDGLTGQGFRRLCDSAAGGSVTLMGYRYKRDWGDALLGSCHIGRLAPPARCWWRQAACSAKCPSHSLPT